MDNNRVDKKCVRCLIFLLSAIILLAGCVTFQQDETHKIDWVNFIKFNGVMYSGSNSLGSGLNTNDLGPQYETVRFTLFGNIYSTKYKIKNGDASYVKTGTPIYTVKGYKPEFRLATYLNGKICLFEAKTNSNAKIGADLLDIKDKVLYIDINNQMDGIKLATIRDEKKIKDLVDMVMKAEIHKIPRIPEDLRYLIVFHLEDGTTARYSYLFNSNVLMPAEIFLPEEFKIAVEKALKEVQKQNP